MRKDEIANNLAALRQTAQAYASRGTQPPEFVAGWHAALDAVETALGVQEFCGFRKLPPERVVQIFEDARELAERVALPVLDSDLLG